MSVPKDRHTYDRDSSSDTEDYHDSDDRRRRVFKNRMRQVVNLIQFCERHENDQKHLHNVMSTGYGTHEQAMKYCFRSPHVLS